MIAFYKFLQESNRGYEMILEGYMYIKHVKRPVFGHVLSLSSREIYIHIKSVFLPVPINTESSSEKACFCFPY